MTTRILKSVVAVLLLAGFSITHAGTTLIHAGELLDVDYVMKGGTVYKD